MTKCKNCVAKKEKITDRFMEAIYPPNRYEWAVVRHYIGKWVYEHDWKSWVERNPMPERFNCLDLDKHINSSEFVKKIYGVKK